MRLPRRSPLFSAVVLAGASLTQVGACGGESEPPTPTESDAATANDASFADARQTDAGQRPVDAGQQPTDAGTCPDGSDRPTPPCAYIK